VVTLVLLCIAFAWYVVLLAAEFLRPRLHFDIRRWATVFPLGMTGVAALSVAAAEHYSWLHTPGQVLTWIGAVAWLATVAAMLYAGRAD
jgi:tellurite resistance protein TehA-like permease